MQLYASLALFIAALMLAGFRTPMRFGRLVGFTLGLLTLFLLVSWHTANRFTGAGINDAVIYTLRTGLDGAGVNEYNGLRLFALAAFLCGLALLLFTFFRPLKNRKSSTGLASASLLAVSLLINPATSDLYQLQATTTATASFDAYYRPPAITSRPDNPKNLVLIYAESFERSYFDEDIFPGLVTDLHQLEQTGVSFTNIVQLPATSWTVAGMTASQMGIPLVTTSGGNSMDGMDQFLPGAKGIGELLSEEGYHMAYLAGAALKFGGKGKLLRTHGFDEVKGINELGPLLADTSYQTSWGLYDDSLFEIAHDRYTELTDAGQPFALFLLTLDTHGEGHSSASCDDKQYGDGSLSILNAIGCSDQLITDFVQSLMASPGAENTVFVIASDHFAGNQANDLLNQTERRNLFLVLEPDNPRSGAIDRLGSTLDIGPTVLSFLGYDGDIGLGRDLLDASPQAAAERETIHQNINGWFSDVATFWEFPQLQTSFSYDYIDSTIEIDDRTFRIPILIEFDEAFNTLIRFGLYQNKSAASYLSELTDDQRFILLDVCANVEEQLPQMRPVFEYKDSTCMVMGRGAAHTQAVRMLEDAQFTRAELEQLLAATVPEAALFGDELTLLNYTISAETPTTVTFNLRWRVDKQPQADHIIFLHMLNADGQRVGQLDTPMGGPTPTSTWQVGEEWYETYTIELGEPLQSGRYTFRVGLYDWPSLEHLPLTSTGEQHLSFGELMIPEPSESTE